MCRIMVCNNKCKIRVLDFVSLESVVDIEVKIGIDRRLLANLVPHPTTKWTRKDVRLHLGGTKKHVIWNHLMRTVSQVDSGGKSG